MEFGLDGKDFYLVTLENSLEKVTHAPWEEL
jgi:hypothetical protein